MSASAVRTGPGTGEIVAGSVLSALLGALIASVYLAARPLEVVKEPPEKPKSGVVYFVEGKKDYEASRRWMFKRDVFVQGQSVQASEGELNFWAESVYPSVATDSRDSKEAKDEPMFSVGTPQFRIQDDELKVSALCKIDLFGLVYEVAVQTAGGFVKVGDHFAYRPREVLVGGLPAQKLGPIGRLIYREVASAYVPPENIADAWKKLSDVHVEGNELILAGS